MLVKLLAILMWRLANCAKLERLLLLLNLSGFGCIYTGQAAKKDRSVKRQSKCNSITVSTIRQYAVKLDCCFVPQITLFFQPDAIQVLLFLQLRTSDSRHTLRCTQQSVSQVSVEELKVKEGMITSCLKVQ